MNRERISNFTKTCPGFLPDAGPSLSPLYILSPVLQCPVILPLSSTPSSPPALVLTHLRSIDYLRLTQGQRIWKVINKHRDSPIIHNLVQTTHTLDKHTRKHTNIEPPTVTTAPNRHR